MRARYSRTRGSFLLLSSCSRSGRRGLTSTNTKANICSSQKQIKRGTVNLWIPHSGKYRPENAPSANKLELSAKRTGHPDADPNEIQDLHRDEGGRPVSQQEKNNPSDGKSGWELGIEGLKSKNLDEETKDLFCLFSRRRLELEPRDNRMRRAISGCCKLSVSITKVIQNEKRRSLSCKFAARYATVTLTSSFTKPPGALSATPRASTRWHSIPTSSFDPPRVLSGFFVPLVFPYQSAWSAKRHFRTRFIFPNLCFQLNALNRLTESSVVNCSRWARWISVRVRDQSEKSSAIARYASGLTIVDCLYRIIDEISRG